MYQNVYFDNKKQLFHIWDDENGYYTLPEKTTKEEFDKKSVLERFDHQLKTSNLKTNNTLKPDFSWASDNVDEIINKYDLKKFILLFPFCSPHLTVKKWPYYEKLIELILEKFGDEYKVITAPGPNEIKDSLNFKAMPVLDNEKALSISQLTALVQKSSFVIANDTGPAHIAAHTNTKGLALFGKHTTAYKVSIERENFKAIQVEDLNNLSAEKVLERMSNFLS
jgi:ADP-heptose:LPS heptosyltransferase